jgi:hypothetical protein
MTTPQAPQRDAATPALPRATKQLIDQLDGWTHEVRHARGRATFGGLSEDTDGDGKRSRIEITEEVDSVCLRARADDGRRLVAVWVKRKTWALDTAFRWPWPWESQVPRQVTATELTAYVIDPVPRDPRELEAEAAQLALDLAELAEHRARWEANRDVWVPIPMRWSTVAHGSVFLDANGAPWTLVSVERAQGGPIVRARHGTQEYVGQPAAPTALVLVPVPERDALTLLRDQLSSRIMERESA